jgi:prepilin-type N-terminal cleavage/methylation domain-containing protein
MKQRQPGKLGFTLPEVIIAIIILSTTSIAVLSTVIFLMGMIELNNNQIIATNLAREGLEIVRNQRDTNWRYWSGSLRNSWNNGFDGITSFDRETKVLSTINMVTPANVEHLFFAVEPNPISITLIDADVTQDGAQETTVENICDSPDERYRLFYNATDGYHTTEQAGDTASPFYRVLVVTHYDNTMSITQPDNTDAEKNANVIKATSIVTYCHNDTPRTTELETYLTDWYQRSSQTDT